MMTPVGFNKKRGNHVVLPPAGSQLAARLLSLERQQIKHTNDLKMLVSD
jgi:hypothetical protein